MYTIIHISLGENSRMYSPLTENLRSLDASDRWDIVMKV